MLSRYANPLTDYGFKKLFGTEPNKDILMDFLNQLLPDEHKISELIYGRNEGVPEIIYSRGVVFDIYCKSERGDRFIVEVQKAKHEFFRDRSVFYSTFPIQEQMKKGGPWNFELSAVYTIGILDFIFQDAAHKTNYITRVDLKDDHNEVFYDKLKYIYIELPKFNKKLEEVETRIDQWIFLLKHLEALDSRPAALRDRIFEKFFEAAEIARYTPDEYSAYHTSWKNKLDTESALDSSYNDGKADGILEGKQNIARAMLSQGFDAEMVAKITGLDLLEVKRYVEK